MLGEEEVVQVDAEEGEVVQVGAGPGDGVVGVGVLEDLPEGEEEVVDQL